MNPPHRRNRRHDWDALRLEWLAGTDTMSAFRDKKGISRSLFLRMTKKHKWKEAREKLRAKVIAKGQEKVEGIVAKRWEQQMRLWGDVESQVQSLLSKKKGLKASDVAALSVALERALKSQRLIRGESTENTVSKNYHAVMVDMVEKLEGGTLDAEIEGYGEEQIPPEA